MLYLRTHCLQTCYQLPYRAQLQEMSYPLLGTGSVNTTIGWTYSSLTCHTSVFIIQGYADRDDIPDNRSLNLSSTSSVLTFPTNITNGSLYWRLLAHDVAGTPCAQESALMYYYFDSNGKIHAHYQKCLMASQNFYSYFSHPHLPLL